MAMGFGGNNMNKMGKIILTACGRNYNVFSKSAGILFFEQQAVLTV
jgi:hypothetical protein